ncbi:MAG: methyl-accepting chemotaxis protein [Eubacterium sp.]|nr:methyl-accepting chemotaxis protein [Eubacterium sp.]
MAEKKVNAPRRGIKRSLNWKILRSTMINILILVVVCCGIMAMAMQFLANNILLDTLQPMARQSAKTVEANIHMLADRMMKIAGDYRMNPENKETAAASRNEVLEEAAEVYELYTIALYDLNGKLIQGIGDAPEELNETFFSYLKETDNLTTDSSTIVQKNLGITMGMPVKDGEETALYVVGVYKYDALDDVIGSINLGKHGMAYMVNREGVVTAHPDETHALEQNTLEQVSGGNAEALDGVTTGETGAAEFLVDGQNILAAFSPVRGTQWSLVIQIPKSDYNSKIYGAMLVAVLATLAVLVVSMLLVLQLARSISRPVKSVTGRMLALSEGDLHTEVEHARSKDELEVLTETLDDTVQSVNRYISDIRQVLTQVADGNLRVKPQVDYKGDFALIRASLGTILQSMNETIAGFRSAAVRLAGMAEELKEQSGQLHHASLEQNQSTEELVCEVSNVKERIAKVSEHSGQTRTKTEEIVQCVQEANERMTSLSGAMDNISANAQEITKIAKAIEDIAFQTNILSINASVEAARAGMAGKGFAVVAEEVRQLASRSAEAAKHATEMVGSTRSIIETGVKLTAATAGSFADISNVSDQIGEFTDHLVIAVQGQEEALAIMEEKIGTISSIADRNLQNAEGTEQSSSLLAREAEALSAQVEKFVTEEGKNG